MLATRTLVAYRDAGFWSQLSRVLLWKLRLWPKGSLPPKEFVGQVSSLYRGTELRASKRKQIHLSRLAITDVVRLWRLTCVWEMHLPVSPRPSSLSL